MEATESLGTWWLPEASQERRTGKLSCSEEGEVRLEIGGVLGGDDSGLERQYPVILGEVTLAKGGATRVTLRNCFVTQRTYSSDPLNTRQSFFAHRAYFGGHLVSGDDFSFGHATITFSSLNSWASSLSGFKREGHFEYAWEFPEGHHGEVKGWQYVLAAACNSSGGIRRKVLEESVGLVLTFPKRMSEPDIQGEVVYPLQNFLTFACDRPTGLTTLRLSRGPVTAENIDVVGPRTFTDTSPVESIATHEMLFNLSDVGDRLTELLTRWLELGVAYHGAFSVYFGGVYRPLEFSDLRLVQIMQVLSLFQAAKDSAAGRATAAELFVRDLDQAATDDQKRRVRWVVETNPLVGAQWALQSLIDNHYTEFEPLLATTKGNSRDAFVQFALRLHEFVYSRDHSSLSGKVEGADMHWLAEGCAFLFKIAILTELGFSAAEVQKLLARNVHFIHLRDKIRLGERAMTVDH